MVDKNHKKGKVENMKKNVFLKLFAYPCGVVVANGNRIVNGDYEKVAFIRKDASIDWQMDKKYLSAEQIQLIEKNAEIAKECAIEIWDKMSADRKMYYVTEYCWNDIFQKDSVTNYPTREAFLEHYRDQCLRYI